MCFEKWFYVWELKFQAQYKCQKTWSENKDGKFALTSSGFHGILKNITITSNELSLDYQWAVL